RSRPRTRNGIPVWRLAGSAADVLDMADCLERLAGCNLWRGFSTVGYWLFGSRSPGNGCGLACRKSSAPGLIKTNGPSSQEKQDGPSETAQQWPVGRGNDDPASEPGSSGAKSGVVPGPDGRNGPTPGADRGHPHGARPDPC